MINLDAIKSGEYRKRGGVKERVVQKPPPIAVIDELDPDLRLIIKEYADGQSSSFNELSRTCQKKILRNAIFDEELEHRFFVFPNENALIDAVGIKNPTETWKDGAIALANDRNSEYVSDQTFVIVDGMVAIDIRNIFWTEWVVQKMRKEKYSPEQAGAEANEKRTDKGMTIPNYRAVIDNLEVSYEKTSKIALIGYYTDGLSDRSVTAIYSDGERHFCYDMCKIKFIRQCFPDVALEIRANKENSACAFFTKVDGLDIMKACLTSVNLLEDITLPLKVG